MPGMPLIIPCLLLTLGAEPGADTAQDRIVYIDNGEIRVGVDQDLGGAITWLSAGGRGNLINNADWGRQIQLSFYSGPRPFEPGGMKAHPSWKSWAWNPIQSGDVYRNRSRVVELTRTDTEIRLTGVPMQWALDNVPGDCRYEARLTLEGPMVKVHYRLMNARSDRAWYGGYHQELPAVYTVSGLERLMTYTGEAPFTDAPLTRIENDWKQKFPWTRYLATEGWVAAVGQDDWGIGVCNPEVYNYLGGGYGGRVSWDSHAGPTTYISPVSTEVLDHNIVFDFDLLVRVGRLADLRRHFTGLMADRALPRWEFVRDRRHWVPVDCVDAGWPIEGRLALTTAQGRYARIEGPVHPFPARSASRLRITGTWRNLAGTGHLTWKRQVAGRPADPGTATFALPSGGGESTVEVDLGGAPAWTGLITQLTVWLADRPADGGSVEIRSVEVVPGRR